MKISPSIETGMTIAPLPRAVVSITEHRPPGFRNILDMVMSPHQPGQNFLQTFSGSGGRMTGQKISPTDLLLLQMEMGRFNLQVELVSKCAEAATGTFKRLQNG